MTKTPAYHARNKHQPAILGTIDLDDLLLQILMECRRHSKISFRPPEVYRAMSAIGDDLLEGGYSIGFETTPRGIHSPSIAGALADIAPYWLVRDTQTDEFTINKPALHAYWRKQPNAVQLNAKYRETMAKGFAKALRKARREKHPDGATD